MEQKNKPKGNGTKKEDITVEVVNKPTEKETEQKTKELSDFLSRTWHEKINSE